MPTRSLPDRRGPAMTPTDWKAPRVHAMLETHIRGEKKAAAGATCGRSRPRGTINEVWNHGVYKYIATYQAIPGRGPRAVNITVELHANSGSMLNGQDDKDRVINYEYNLVYGLDGRVDETNPWRGRLDLGGRAKHSVRPLNVLELVESRWGGHNQTGDRGERAVDRPGQWRRRAAAFRAKVPDLPAGGGVRGRPPADVRCRFRRYDVRSPRFGGFFRRFFGGR